MRVLATASAGTNRLLAQECGDLGLRPRRVPAHGVELDTDWQGVAKAMLHLRIAQRVLIYIGRFPCDGAKSLYDGARAFDWSEFVDPEQTIAVAAAGQLPRKSEGGPLTNHVFAVQRIKDAIVDDLRERCGSRPNVDPVNPDVRFMARFHGDACSLWLDPCGQALHRRGYRIEAGAAPLRETLAAAVIAATDWQGNRPLLDPMCGSGTLLIEAAGFALGLAAGRNRSFSGERWRHHGVELGGFIAAEREAAIEHAVQACAKPNVTISGSDHNAKMVTLSEENIARAGLSGVASVRCADACRMPAPAPGTVIATNPPYGERLGGDDVRDLYAAMGRNWRNFQGCEAHILDGHDEFVRAFGLRWTDELQLNNGSLPVSLRFYELGGD